MNCWCLEDSVHSIFYSISAVFVSQSASCNRIFVSCDLLHWLFRPKSLRINEKIMHFRFYRYNVINDLFDQSWMYVLDWTDKEEEDEPLDNFEVSSLLITLFWIKSIAMWCPFDISLRSRIEHHATSKMNSRRCFSMCLTAHLPMKWRLQWAPVLRSGSSK